MVSVIDIDDEELSLRQLIQSVKRSSGVFLRRKGTVIARLEPADELDLEDDAWARAPQQVARGRAARKRFEEGRGIPLEEVKRRLGLNKGAKPRTRGKSR